MYFNIFENKAYLLRGQTLSSESESMIKKDIFGEFSRVLIISAEICNTQVCGVDEAEATFQGNDLAVNYIYYTTFKDANLENANFKNAGLMFVNFNSANLTNVDLSGADLRKAFLGNSDLSNADLSNANLEGAILDNAILSNTNLKCLNHPICLND